MPATSTLIAILPNSWAAFTELTVVQWADLFLLSAARNPLLRIASDPNLDFKIRNLIIDLTVT